MIRTCRKVVESIRARFDTATGVDRGGPPDTLAWISIPRSGSTYLCDLLDFHPAIHSCLEVFHRKKVYSRDPEALLAHLNEKHSTSFRESGEEALIKFSHERSLEFLEALRTVSGRGFLSYKVFPGHLSSAQLRQLILADRGTAKLLFKRQPLAAYVSKKKAIKKNAWEFTDTSSIKVSLDAKEFKKYVSSVNDWFDSIQRYLEGTGQPYAIINYEELMEIEGDRARLERIVEKVRSVGVKLPSLEESVVKEFSVGRKKQDKSKTLQEGIENFEQFQDGLRRLGLENHLESC